MASKQSSPLGNATHLTHPNDQSNANRRARDAFVDSSDIFSMISGMYTQRFLGWTNEEYVKGWGFILMRSYRDEQVFAHLNLGRCRTPKTCHIVPVRRWWVEIFSLTKGLGSEFISGCEAWGEIFGDEDVSRLIAVWKDAHHNDTLLASETLFETYGGSAQTQSRGRGYWSYLHRRDVLNFSLFAMRLSR